MEAQIKPGKTGQFDVVVDGELIFSKHKENRFPSDDEILAQLPPS